MTYELRGTLKAKPGQRDALFAILQQAAADAPAMRGCLEYEVSLAAADPDAIAVHEQWVDKESHDASLALPTLRAAIARARPLLASTERG